MTLWGHIAALTARVKELEERQEQLRKMYEFYTRDAGLKERFEIKAEHCEDDTCREYNCLGCKVEVEPKTTDYCSMCGESPDSGAHLFNHEYKAKEKAPVSEGSPVHLVKDWV